MIEYRYLIVAIELHDRAVGATPPAIQVEFKLYVEYGSYGGDHLVHILARYPNILRTGG